ncbi:MAG: hypothetical protein FWH20_05100 [Oscillospiraceae bacterium]|nr:hypothetical protein [Oscillospiraceae bacterium]
MRRKFALLLAGIMLVGLVAACGGEPETAEVEDREPPDVFVTPPPEDEPEVEEEEPVEIEIVIEPEPVSHEFANEQTEELFSMIIADMDVWNYGTLMGGSLIDLDFDGTPEFLVYHCFVNEWDGLEGTNIVVYKFTADGLVEIADLISNYSTSAGLNRHISLYTDENGDKSWALPYQIVDGDTTDYRFSLFDFTTQPPTEFIKFQVIYDGYLYEDGNGNIPYYYNGEELFLTDEEIAVYQELYKVYEAELEWYERDRDDYLENSEKVYYFEEGLFAEGIYPPTNWFAFDVWEADFYANVNEKWLILQNQFKAALIPNAYRVDPNFASWEEGQKYWKDMDNHNLEQSILKLVNAYVEDDRDFFIDPLAFSVGAYAKPVIYLYPEEITDIEVTVEFPLGGGFTVTYPDYGNGWRVTAAPDGTLINHADGREYSYLYWDGKGPANWDLSSGFVVKGSDTVAFLQEKLEYLGMIPREYNEFIVYWLPIMQGNAYNLITFQTAAYEAVAPMYVSPAPDSVLRVFMAFMPLDKPISIPEQDLQSFVRSGFAVIEWGGTELG